MCFRVRSSRGSGLLLFRVRFELYCGVGIGLDMMV